MPDRELHMFTTLSNISNILCTHTPGQAANHCRLAQQVHHMPQSGPDYTAESVLVSLGPRMSHLHPQKHQGLVHVTDPAAAEAMVEDHVTVLGHVTVLVTAHVTGPVTVHVTATPAVGMKHEVMCVAETPAVVTLTLAAAAAQRECVHQPRDCLLVAAWTPAGRPSLG